MAKQRIQWIPFYWADYMEATKYDTPLQHGVYQLLMNLYYEEQGPIPANKQQLAYVLRLRTEEELKALDYVCDSYFTQEGAGQTAVLRNKRADTELAEAIRRIEAKRAGGKEGGKSTSDAKKTASRANGKNGGRPRKPNPNDNPNDNLTPEPNQNLETQSNPTHSHIQEHSHSQLQRQEENTHTQTATKTQNQTVCVSLSKPSGHVMKWIPTEMHSTKWKDGEQQQLAQLEQQYGADKLACAVEQYWLAQPDANYFSKTVYKWTDFLAVADTVWLDKVTPGMIDALKTTQLISTPEGKAEYARKQAEQIAQGNAAFDAGMAALTAKGEEIQSKIPTVSCEDYWEELQQQTATTTKEELCQST